MGGFYDPYGYGYQRFDPSAYNPWVRAQRQERLNQMQQNDQQYLNNGYPNMQNFNNQQMGNMQQGNIQQQCILMGRPVSNYEEANAAMINLDGSIFYFPCTNNAEIYTKQIGLDGNPIVNVYKLSKNNNINQNQNQNQNQNNAFDFNSFMNAPNQNNNENNQAQPMQNNPLIDASLINENSEEVKKLNQKVRNLENYVNTLEMEIKRYVQSNANVNGYAGEQSTRTSNDAEFSTNTELTKPATNYDVDVWQQSDDATSYAENAR